MSISAESTDYINWAYLLKGNYRKGVHRLREIMGTPGQAQEFCSNAGAMALVLGHDPDHPDANSEQLRELILGSTYVDFAIEHWFPLVFPGETAETVTASSTYVTAAIAGSTTAPALAASNKWLARALCTMAEYSSLDGIESLDDMAETNAAVDAIVANEVTLAYIATSSAAIAALEKSTYAAVKIATAALSGSEAAMDIADKSEVIQSAMESVDPGDVTVTDQNFQMLFDNDVLCEKFKTNATFIQKTANKYAANIASQDWKTIGKIASIAVNDTSKFSACQGKKKSIAISGNGTHSFTIAGVGVDSGCAFTFICDDLVGTHAMNSSNTTSGGWERCQMRSWLSGTLLNNFPAEVRNIMKTVGKKNTSGYGAATTKDKLWIPSQTEVGLTSGNAEGAKYGIFNSNSDRIRKNGGSASVWWLRSVYSSAYFRRVISDGSLNDGYASYAFGVCPCFCI